MIQDKPFSNLQTSSDVFFNGASMRSPDIEKL